MKRIIYSGIDLNNPIDSIKKSNNNSSIHTAKIENVKSGGLVAIWGIVTKFFLSFDTNINDSIVKICYILIKLVCVIILYFKNKDNTSTEEVVIAEIISNSNLILNLNKFV